MENATKALLIAAAVLVAIIIISLTLAIVQQGQDAVGRANISEAEMTQFNQKFTSYEGSNISTSQANQLLSTVFSHNQNEKNTGDGRYVTVDVNSTTNTGADLTDSSTGVTKLTGSDYYNVKCEFTSGLVTKITLKSVQHPESGTTE